MLQSTQGIVLRSIKYGETSFISTVFTKDFGVQSYIIKGVRSQQSKHQKAALLQPSSLIDLVVYNKTNQNLLYLKEFQASYIYQQIQEQVIVNSVALFSSEFLLRILPEHAPFPELFIFSRQFLELLDRTPVNDVANFPLYFIAVCSKMLGYDVKGNYSTHTPFLNIVEGGFSEHTPLSGPLVTNDQAFRLSSLLRIESLQEIKTVEMNAMTRHQLLEWYLDFLHYYCQHLGEIKSLRVLQAILH